MIRLHKTTPGAYGFPMAGRCILFFTMLFALSFSAHAQRNQRFKAGILAGVTAAQIDGDASAGYNKVGLQAGLRGIVLLNQKQDASIEILFTQRGSRNEAKTPPFFKTTLNYIEVPVQWHYTIGPPMATRKTPIFTGFIST